MALHPPPPFDPWAWAQAWQETALVNLAPAAWARPLRVRRLAALMDSALRDSPLYQRRARGARRLGELEPVTKAELMAGFDDWATDRRITLEGARAFLARDDNIADAWLGRYMVWTSSGTSGEPGLFVQDAASLGAYDAIDALRLRGPTMVPGPWCTGRRFAYVAATSGHFAGLASVLRLRRLALPGWAPCMQVLSVATPLPELAAELQAMSPQVLVTYPSCAVALAEMQIRGELRLKLEELWLGGEQLSPAQRQTLRKGFACTLRNNYGASECLSIACECRHGRLHLHHDWVMLETLDRHGNPVPPGEDAHTVALTNLANRTQPLLRYVMGDRVRYHAAPCACGSPFPAIEVEGRADDTLHLPDGYGGQSVLLPLALEGAIEDQGGVAQFQLLQRQADTLELRLPAGTPEVAWQRALAALQALLQRHEAAGVQVLRGHQAPQADPRSGKLHRVVALRAPEAVSADA